MDEMRAAEVSRYIRTKAEEAGRTVEIALQLPTSTVKDLVHFVYIELSGHPDRAVSKQRFNEFINELIKYKLVPHAFVPHFSSCRASDDFRSDVTNAQTYLEEKGILIPENTAGVESYKILRELPVPESHIPPYQQ